MKSLLVGLSALLFAGSVVSNNCEEFVEFNVVCGPISPENGSTNGISSIVGEPPQALFKRARKGQYVFSYSGSVSIVNKRLRVMCTYAKVVPMLEKPDYQTVLYEFTNIPQMGVYGVINSYQTALGVKGQLCKYIGSPA